MARATVLILGFLLFGLWFPTKPGLAYTFQIVGIRGDPLVLGDRVCFVQADGSLTCLDVETGSVILRKKFQYPLYSIFDATDGIICRFPESSALLSKSDFELKWEADGFQSDLTMARTQSPVKRFELEERRFRCQTRKSEIALERYWSDDLGVGYTLMSVLLSDGSTWSGVLPSLLSRSWQAAFVVELEEDLLLSVVPGQFERIEARTGRSKWLYKYPTAIATASSSSWSPAPSYGSYLLSDHFENERRKTEPGVQLLPVDLEQKGIPKAEYLVHAIERTSNVIHDPKPYRPLRIFFLHSLPIGTAFFLPLILLLLIRVYRSRNDNAFLRGDSIVMTAGGYMNYGALLFSRHFFFPYSIVLVFGTVFFILMAVRSIRVREHPRSTLHAIAVSVALILLVLGLMLEVSRMTEIW